MERLLSEFNELMQEDQSAPNHKKHGTTMVLAIRQWQYSLFKKSLSNSDHTSALPSETTLTLPSSVKLRATADSGDSLRADG